MCLRFHIRNIRKKIFLFFILHSSFFILHSSAQEGSSYITNFNLSESVYSNQNWAIVQDNDEVMLFANRRGILTYDGAAWQEISLPDIVFTMVADPHKNRIYAGCRNGFGYLSKDEKGVYRYTELSSQKNNISEITRIELTSDAVYFYSSESLSRCKLNNLGNTQQWLTEDDFPFSGIIKLKDKIYLRVSGKGLFVLENDSLQEIKNASAPAEILFSAQYDENRAIVGTGNDELFLFDGKIFTKFLFEGQKHITENILTTGLELSEYEIAVGTVTGGCIIINKKTGETAQIINYRTGLPDDELFAIGKDRNNGLWLAHEYGLSRIDNNLPIRNFSSYPGLEGNLNAVADFAGTIYVATGRGVFYLTKTFDTQEVKKLIQLQDKEKLERMKTEEKKQIVQPDFQKVFQVPLESEKQDEKSEKEIKKELREEKKKKNKEKWNEFFGIKKKKEKEKTDEIPVSEEEDNEPEKIIPKGEVPQAEKVVPEKEKQAEKTQEKKSFPLAEKQETQVPTTKFGTYIYKRVNGLDEKCKQLYSFKDQLLVATNSGLFSVKDNNARMISTERYINCITPSADENRLYVGTTTGVFSILWNNNSWTMEMNFENFKHPVYSVTHERGKILWLGSDGVAYRATLDENSRPLNIRAYNFEKDFAEKVITARVEGKTHFFVASGIYTYDGAKDSLIIADKNPDGSGKIFNRRYISTQENITWVYNNNERKWKSYKNEPSENLLFSAYLDLFDGIQHIYLDKKNNFWVIDGDNNLFKILPSETFMEMHNFNVYIRGVSDNRENSFSLEKLVVDASNNMLSFRIAAPYYLKTDATEYQYKIDGLMDDWSKWDSKPEIGPFPLPAGNYTLRVRARNILGKVSDEKTLSFSINPPFYKTWYFYLLYALAGAALVWVFIRFREASLKREQVLLEEKVRQRTAELAAQKEKTEELLLNILPKETAEELKSKGHATTRHYNMASVMFTDFKDFTKISENMKPAELVDELDLCFKTFDDIIGKYGLEKIKTIGDSYMCAGGIPKADDFNPIRITLAALEICDFMEKRRKDKNIKAPFEIRIGIHTGPITAGVVGKKKFAYDIWSDTVNTASRMESSGKTGKVNISGTTHEFIKTYFDCEHRGKVEAKNKGQIEMYFVTGIKEKYSVNADGRTPNELLLEILEGQSADAV